MEDADYDEVTVFPARAGVIRAAAICSTRGKSFPRTRGGDPSSVVYVLEP